MSETVPKSYQNLTLKEAVALLNLGEIHPNLPSRVLSLAHELKVEFDSEVFHYITDMDKAVGDGSGSFISYWPKERRVVVLYGRTEERGEVSVTPSGGLRKGKGMTF